MQWVEKHRRLLFIAVLLVLLLLYLPARLIAFGLPEPIKFSGLSGTLWSGQAARAWIRLGNEPLMLGQVRWQVIPWRLFWSAPVRLTSQWGPQHIDANVGFGIDGSLRLSDALFSLDATFLKTLFPLYLDAALSGVMRHLEIKDGLPVSVDGSLTVSHAVWTAKSGDVPLGTYEITLSGDDFIRGTVTTSEGPLLVNGEVMLSGQSYKIDLQGAGAMALDQNLQRAIMLVAEPTPQGFALLLEGNL